METLESALERLLEHANPVRETERLPLCAALGRVCAQEVVSPMDVPPFDRSPLDGYALHSGDIAGASREAPVVLTVVGEACAGCGKHFDVARGQALRIMTGAPVAPMCDCVIRQEDTDEGMDAVCVYAPVGAGKNICRAGEDVPAGATLTARLCEMGVEANVSGSCPDEPQAVANALQKAAAHADVLITTGGVSVGKKDIMHRVLPLADAQRLFWKVAMKPGSPLLCGLYDGKLILFLSGNPFAALACFEVFAAPVLRRLAGQSDCRTPRAHATLHGGFPKSSPGRRLIRARYEGGDVYLTGENHSSGSLSTMIGCNAFIDIPAGSGPLADGDEVEVLLL